MALHGRDQYEIEDLIRRNASGVHNKVDSLRNLLGFGTSICSPHDDSCTGLTVSIASLDGMEV